MRARLLLPALLLLAVCGLAASASGASAKTRWLCRPGMAADPCTVSTAARSIAASGAGTTQPAARAGARPVDCFYVYPTVSGAPGLNAPIASTASTRAVATQQASRYAPVCRVFAPIYPQLTVGGLSRFGPAQDVAVDKAYAGVRAAWREYLAKDNHGRGVILIGHSQGSGMLRRLIAEEIDPKAKARALLVAAHLLGGDITVKDGSDRGGDFRNVPACTRGSQTGCVVAYSSYLHTPPNPTIFGRTPSSFKNIFGGDHKPGVHVLCTDPTKLAGDPGVLSPYFRVGGTPAWVTYPDRYRAACRSDGGAYRLQVTPLGGAADTRPIVTESLGPIWGLHLYDVNMALGDLVTAAKTEAAAWRAASGRG